MNKYIDEILVELFPNENTQVYAPHFEVIYDLVFENANKSEHTLLKNEIIECEREYVDNIRMEVEFYQNPTPEFVMNKFIGTAFKYAKMRYESNKPVRCAIFLRDIFSEFIGFGFVPEKVKEANKRIISDALVDFSYATGITDNMSFRFRDYVC